MGRRKVVANEARIPDDKLERLLLDLVNAHVTEAEDGGTKAGDDAGRIFRRYSRYLPHVPSTTEEAFKNLTLLLVLRMRRKQPGSGLLPKDEAAYQRGIVAEFRDWLQAIWAEEDPETAEWRLAGLHALAQELMAGNPRTRALAPEAPPSRPDAETRRALADDAPLSQALAYLWRKLGKLRKCPNPKCPNRLFIAVKDSQQCCSPECASVKRSKDKEAWWRRKRQKLDEGRQPEGESAAMQGRVKKSEVQGEQPRMDEVDVKAFILDVVNADEGKTDDGTMYLFSQYPAFFPTRERDIKAVLPLALPHPALRESMKGEFPRMYHRRLFRDLRDGLRKLWQSDESTAEWAFFGLQSAVHSRVEVRGGRGRALRPPSTHVPIHQALRWVWDHFPKLRKCRNDNCSRLPFFVADRNERFCSEECAKAAERAHKLAWWFSDKGKRWKRKRAEGKGGPQSPVPDPERR